MDTSLSNPEPLFIKGTTFPVLKPQVAVDLSHELRVVIPAPTTDPFDTTAWDELQKALNDVHNDVTSSVRNHKKRQQHPAREEVSVEEVSDDEDEQEPEKEVLEEESEEEEDLRMALETQKALDGQDRVFQSTQQHQTSDYLERMYLQYPTKYRLNSEDNNLYTQYYKLNGDEDEEEKE